MRLIDADALEEEIRAKDIMGGLNYSLFIRNAPTIEMRRPDKWIPVSESIQEKQANADKIDAVYIDGFKAGYSQARFDLEQQPCDDAISRQAVLEKAINVPIAQIVTEDEVICRKIVFVDDIENMPPVTPQQKYGKWIKHPEIETSTPEYLMFYECSECGDKQCFCKSDIHKKRFCSNCGCRMVEPQESEDKE